MPTIYGLAHVADRVIRYVGQTGDPEDRLYTHRSMGRSARRLPSLHHLAVYRWMASVGPDWIILIRLEECSRDVVIEREEHWIDALGTRAPDGFNWARDPGPLTAPGPAHYR